MPSTNFSRRRSACRRAVTLAGLAALALTTTTARAAPPPLTIAIPDDSDDGAHQGGAFDFLKNWRRDGGLLGDMWGLRTDLAQHGITFAIEETSEVLGNATGGVHKSLDYDGLTQAVLQVNSARAFGYYGGTFNVSGLQLHGINLSQRNLLSLQTASGIESDRATRLWELWYDQKLLPEDRLDLRIGQQSLDQEWMVSTNALVFVNTMFGWPMLPSADLPGGGPAYPLSAPGVRLRYRPVNAVSIQLGAFSSSPFNISNARAQALGADPQQLDPSGTSFPFFHHGALLLAELQYSAPALGGMVSPDAKQPLARTYRLGVWYDTEQFADVRYGGDGLPLANPDSDGSQRLHRGNLGMYGTVDQIVWRSLKDPNRTLSVFGRAMGTPFANRNLINFSANLGMVLKDPFTYRTDDTLGLAMGFAHVSGDQARADRDIAVFNGIFNPARTSETFIEMTYQRQITPWLQIQPDVQYVFNPGGGVANPYAADTSVDEKVGNELVVGVRANILL